MFVGDGGEGGLTSVIFFQLNTLKGTAKAPAIGP